MKSDVLAEVADHHAIDRLQRAYADVVNRRAWGDLPPLFLPEATIELDLVTSPVRTIAGPEALGQFVGAALEAFSFFEFVILNSHVELLTDGDPDRATARMFMRELRLRSGETARSDVFGLYRDHYLRTPSGWRIEQRRYRSMARFPEADVFPLPPDLV